MRIRPALATGASILLIAACAGRPQPPAPQPPQREPVPAAHPDASSPTAPLAAAPQQPTSTSTTAWEGLWQRRSSRFDPATLRIVARSPGKLGFNVDATNGAHSGQVQGELEVGSDHASYSADGCALELARKDGTIELRSSGCESELGAGVSLDGTYAPSGSIRTFKTAFDCAKAATRVESMICADELLASADVAMDAAYRRGYAGAQGLHSVPNMKAVEAFEGVQRDWLRARDKCAAATDSRTCLLRSYRTRLMALRNPKAGAGARIDVTTLRTAAAGRDASAFWDDVVLRLYLAERLGTRYEALLDKMMIVNSADDPNAAAIEGCVRGVCPDVRGYVAIDRTGSVWAAMADGKDATVFAPPSGRLPVSLDRWIASLQGVKVARVKVFE